MIMETLTTNLGETLKISANHSKRTFTIRTDVAKYRTIRLSKEEFQSCLNNTGQDWRVFLRSSDYYKVR
jgi:arsenate reductase-like glutaredoxin family protein